MARILITGSTDGIGQAAAKLLSEQGHAVFLHARNQSRAAEAQKAVPNASGVFIADISTIAGAKSLASQINEASPPFESIVHNAGLGPGSKIFKTEDGAASTIAVNTLAPYIVTALLEQQSRPKRLLYLSSSLHYSGNGDLSGVDGSWETYGSGPASSAYNDSKLHDALLARAVARLWKGTVQTGALDPGWVATKMGGGGAPVKVGTPAKAIAEFAVGGLSFVGDKGGLYFTASEVKTPHKDVESVDKEDEFLERCQKATGVSMPRS